MLYKLYIKEMQKELLKNPSCLSIIIEYQSGIFDLFYADGQGLDFEFLDEQSKDLRKSIQWIQQPLDKLEELYRKERNEILFQIIKVKK